MANTKQAKKRAAQSDRRRARNRSVVTRVRNVVKNLRRTAETEAAKVGGLLSNAVSELDVAVRKGEYIAFKAKRAGPMYCSGGGGVELYSPPLSPGGAFRSRSSGTSCLMLVQLVYK